MSNFARVKALGWSLFDILQSSLMNQLDIDHTKAPNFDEGSTHSPTGWISLLGSFGFDIASNFKLTASSDQQAQIDSPNLPGAASRRLLLRTRFRTSADRYVRLYVSRDVGFEITVNAVWSGTEWSADSAGAAGALRITFSEAQVIYEVNTSLGGTWTTWPATSKMQLDGRNPSGNPDPNTIYPLSIVKAWGRVESDGGGNASIPAADFLNISAVTISSSEFLVTMPEAMADANYIVIPTLETVTGDGSHAVGRPVSTTQFRVRVQNGSGVVNVGSIARACSFVVLGKQ